MIQDVVGLPQQVIDGEWVEYVYRSQFGHFDHVLVPAGRFNVFLVIVVDRVRGSGVWSPRSRFEWRIRIGRERSAEG
jgi:hypothetical protein